MILLIAATKGGVGKTTLALNLGIAAALNGRNVWLVDGDRQGTLSAAITLRADSGRLPPLACSQYRDGAALRHQVQFQAKNFDDVVIDAGGRDSSSLRAALTLADTLLVPLQPRSYDVWALADIDAIVGEALAVRGPLRALAVLNCADTQGSDNADAAAAVGGCTNIHYLDTPIYRRKAYANAAGGGLSVLEGKGRGRDRKACLELKALAAAVFAPVPRET